MVNSMLDISQIESGSMQMNLGRADLRQIVSSTVALFQHDARAREVTLHTEMPARLPRMMLDAERIQQVLINLMGNALKFTPQGGKIAVGVRYRAEAQEVTIKGSDTGIGMAPDELDKVFDEFVQIRRQSE